MKRLSIAGLAGAALLIAAPAFAANVATEITTAHTHAIFASKASSITAVHMHMHHALNCLVGPKGEGYDASQMDPCKGSGNGAIPDEMDAAKKSRLETAKTDLVNGIAATNMATAKSAATSAAETLASIK